MTLPRVIFCAFLSSLPRTLCAPSVFPNPFRPPTSPSLSTNVRTSSPDRCFVLMNTLMGAAAFLAVASGMAQWSVALRVREYARSLRSSGLEEEEKADLAGGEWRDAVDEKRAMSLA